ncbi:hypothetical protein Q9233_017851 [Columba guinea]|nr:hypothetical protein Q9233_017851 [Columba guinea]
MDTGSRNSPRHSGHAASPRSAAAMVDREEEEEEEEEDVAGVVVVAPGRVQARLRGLTDARDRLLALRDAEMRRNRECLENAKAERRRVVSAFDGLRILLEDAARPLLARLGALERDVEQAQEETATALTTEISRLDAAIRQLEETRRQPAGAFLRDIGGTLSRCDEGHFQPPTALLTELEEKIGHFRERNVALEETLRSFQDVLMFELPEKRGPVRRSDESPAPPSVDLWSMGLCHGQFWALTSLERVPLRQLDVPKRVRVSLDYDKGHVAFFDADKRSLIFTFPAASFGGERVQPWFLVWGEGARITLRP